MDVRDFPPEKLCDLCRARIAKMTIRDELTLLKALCATCEGAVAGADRPAKLRRVRLYRIWLEELERRFAAAYAPRHGTRSIADAIQRRLNEPPDQFRPDYGISLLELPKVGDEWDTYPAPGVKVHYTMLKDGIVEATVTLPPIARQLDVEIGFTNPDPVPPTQLALYEHMAYLSSEHWCAGWMDRLGEKLQGIIDRDNHHPAGYVAFTVEEFEKLKHLHAEAGGWWVWDDAVVDGPEGDCVRFVPDVAK